MQRLQAFLEHPRFTQILVGLIIINAVVLGLQTSDAAMAKAGGLLQWLDWIILAVFTVELALKIIAYRLKFFTDPWSLFDLAVVSLSFTPPTEELSILRALRVLRVLRLISAVPQMRRVVQALLSALPGMGTISALMAVMLYVAAVITTNLFGEAFPQKFGSIGASLYSLFQLITLEGWSDQVVQPVMEVYPWAWAFFIPFILIAAFAVLNLFVAILVDSISDVHEAEREENRVLLASLRDDVIEEVEEEEATLLSRLDSLSSEINALRAELRERGNDRP